MNISKVLVKIADSLKVKFTLNERTVTTEEIFAETGLLPALSRRADQLCSLCLGYGIGASFDEATSSLLGVKVTFDDITPNTLRILCITDVLMEIVKASPSKTTISLDELMYD